MRVKLHGKRASVPPKICRSNYLPEIEQQCTAAAGPARNLSAILEVRCGLCQENRLDISRSAAPHGCDAGADDRDGDDDGDAKTAEGLAQMGTYRRHRIERTVLLPCGHMFGRECVADLMTNAAHGNTAFPTTSSGKSAKNSKARSNQVGASGSWRCPTCEAPSTYAACGHARAPVVLPLPPAMPLPPPSSQRLSHSGFRVSIATASSFGGRNSGVVVPLQDGPPSPPPSPPLSSPREQTEHGKSQQKQQQRRDAIIRSIQTASSRPCKECAWRNIRAKLRLALSADCMLCNLGPRGVSRTPTAAPTTMTRAREISDRDIGFGGTDVETDPEEEKKRLKEHAAHRDQHLEQGLRTAMTDIMRIVWPSSESISGDQGKHLALMLTGGNIANLADEKGESSHHNAKSNEEEAEIENRRQAMASLALTMALADLGDTIYCRRPSLVPASPSAAGGSGSSGGVNPRGGVFIGKLDEPLPPNRRREHDEGVAAIERQLLMCLMNPDESL